MIAAAPIPQHTAGDDSWDAFAGMLGDEAAALSRLNAAALYLTQVLVDGTPDGILEADRQLNSARTAHAAASAKRRGMQVRGFGQMTLQQVCNYAPRHLWPRFNQRLAELTYGSISLGITLGNNKSLIVAGLERLVKITSKLQENMSERTGVYKRRGFVAPVAASVLMSSHV
ncbi:MAG: hypothetical protein ABR508_02390 [Candidatus Baltobacteraceae bacterium]